MTQAQLTYAQKVKQKQQQQLGRQQQLQQLQQQQQQQMQTTAQAQPIQTIQPVQQARTMQQPTAPPTLQTQQSIPRVQPTVATATVSSTTAKPSSFRMVPAVVQSVQPVPAQSVMQNALSSYTYPYSYRTRDFFDRGVQSNVSQAVNQYYNYQAQRQQSRTQTQSRAQPTFTSRQSQNRWAVPANRAPQPQPSSNRRSTPQSTVQGRPSQDSRMMRGGGGYANSSRSRMNGSVNPNQNYLQNGGSRPPTQSQNRYGPSPSPNGNPNLNSRGMNSAPKARCPPVTSSSGPNTPPHRDVLCWIFENQGHCRYGAKCQWLHLDRETGQYVPTMYVTNSLDRKAVKKALTGKSQDERGDTKAKPAGDDTKDKEADDEPEQDLETIKSKFQLLMEKNIARREKEKAQSLLEEDTKESKEESPSGSEKCVPVDSKSSSSSSLGRAKGKGGYGSYGTTFDRHNVCWEFNTFVGCRKGASCKWAHQYLAKESAHPYTGEKLNGLAVKKFRQSNGL